MAKRRDKERRRGKRRENRNERMKKMHSGGGDWACITVPEGLDVFKPEAGETYNIDIVPYIVGKYNRAADPGDEYWELSYAVYNNLGIDDKRYIAIGEMLGTRDPVAEHFAALRKQDAEWDLMKEFKAKWRQLMLIFVHEQADKGLQLFEGAFGTLGEQLKEELDALGEVDWAENLDDPDHGATLEVRFKGKNIGQKNPWVLAAKVNLVEREDGFTADGNKKLADQILTRASEICLDDCLKVVDYETLKAALDGTPVVDDEPGGPVTEEPEPEPENKVPPRETKTKGKAKGKAKPKQPTAADLGIEKGGDVTHDEYGVCTVLRVAKDGYTVTIMDDDDDVYKNVDPTDLEPIVERGEEPGQEEVPEGDNEETTARAEADAEADAEAAAGDDDWDDDWSD